jgi:arsenate reductase
MLQRLKILFLCTGNSCRSQMAEAWTRQLHPDRFEAYSAGTSPGRIDPRAVRVMSEAGVDMSRQRSKGLEELAIVQMDVVITVCDSANEACSVFPGTARRFHAGFDDPPLIAKSAVSEEETLLSYRRVRDEIRNYVAKLPDLIALPATDAGT